MKRMFACFLALFVILLVLVGNKNIFCKIPKQDCTGSNLVGSYLCDAEIYKDTKKAVKCLKKAAEQGHRDAQFNLGLCYFNGLGVDENLKEAARWWRKSAEQGHADSQYLLGIYYLYGVEADKDPKRAVEWLKKAAEQEHREAQYNLGICCAKGKGLSKDLDEAAYWFSKAAAQGHANAQEALKNLNAKEISTPKTSKKIKTPLQTPKERNARLKQLKENLQNSDSIIRKAKAKAYDGRRLISSGEAKANRKDYIAAEGTTMARFISMEQTRQTGREEIRKGEALIRESEEDLAKINETIEEIERISESFELENKDGQKVVCRPLEIERGKLYAFAKGRVYELPLNVLTDKSRELVEKALKE